MRWFKSENHEEETSDSKKSPILVYLSPEALEKTFVIDDFNSFQNTPECVPGGRLLEVSRQYTYNLRQVADLVEEPLENESLKVEPQSKRDFHSEIKPDKKLLSRKEENKQIPTHHSSFQDSTFLESEVGLEEPFESQGKLNTENVPFKDLESLFSK